MARQARRGRRQAAVEEDPDLKASLVRIPQVAWGNGRNESRKTTLPLVSDEYRSSTGVSEKNGEQNEQDTERVELRSDQPDSVKGRKGAGCLALFVICGGVWPVFVPYRRLIARLILPRSQHSTQGMSTPDGQSVAECVVQELNRERQHASWTMSMAVEDSISWTFEGKVV